MKMEKSRFQVGTVHEGCDGEYEILEKYKRGKSWRYKVRLIKSGYISDNDSKDLYGGVVKDYTIPSVQGVGYMSHGDYPKSFLKDGRKVNHPCYETWVGILKRCYSGSSKCYENYGGKGVTVCEDWLDYTKFYEWFMPKHKEGFCVDKDILSQGYKGVVYSPDTCEIVPYCVNSFLTNSRRKRGLYPVGVCRKDNKNGDHVYIAQVGNLDDRQDYLGRFDTMHEAFMAYKIARESLARQLAVREYKAGNISEKIYNRFLEWGAAPYP